MNAEVWIEGEGITADDSDKKVKVLLGEQPRKNEEQVGRHCSKMDHWDDSKVSETRGKVATPEIMDTYDGHHGHSCTIQ